MDMLIRFIIILAVVAICAYLAKYIIDTFFPEPVKTPALLIVGVVLLIALLYGVSAIVGGQGLKWPS